MAEVKTMEKMFYKCEKLPFLNLLSFDTSEVLNMEKMFSNCSKLEKINVSGNGDWTSVPQEKSIDMFEGCVLLPYYSQATSNKDSRYAKIGNDINKCFFSEFDLGEGWAALEGTTLMFYTSKDSGMPEKQFDVPTDSSKPAWSSVADKVETITFSDSFGIWSTKIT